MGDDDVLELIRVACGAVAERARFVRIDSDVLAAYPQRYENDAGAEPEDGVRTPAGDDEATTALVLQLDAINFGSGWHPVLYKRPGLSGSRMVAACWRERAARDGVMTAGELAVIDGAAVAAILEQESEGPAGDLMRLFARSLAELGCHLLGHYGGSFSKFVASANGSAAALTTALTGLPMWQDAADHDDAVVPLFKRAQIVSADLARAFAGSGPGAFNDLDRLTLFADNVVPHVLRLDGVLVYDNTLVRRIDAGDLLEPGSPEEVEIRAVAVHAVERLATIQGVGRSHVPWQIDETLWRRGAAPRYKAVPRHRCRTTAY